MGGINAKTAHSQIFPQYQDLHVLKKTKTKTKKQKQNKKPNNNKKTHNFLKIACLQSGLDHLREHLPLSL